MAYLINLNNAHWFAFRNIQNQWFNLNSYQAEPTSLTNPQLDRLISEYEGKKYSIFVVLGNLDAVIDCSVLQNEIQAFNNSVLPQFIETFHMTSAIDCEETNTCNASYPKSRAQYFKNYRARKAQTKNILTPEQKKRSEQST